MGLAIGAGYVLGRTKKLKLAMAVGTFVAGKRMNLTPKAVAELVSGQLKNNPQFKEIGDQLRVDLRGVGKAASGAMVERQIDAIADRLHGRTAQVRDQLSGVVPDLGSKDDDRAEDSGDEEPEEDYEESEAEQADEGDEGDQADEADEEPERRRGPAAKKAPAKRAPAKKEPARKTAGKKTAAARDAGRGARNRLPKGGGE
jgi:cobalamin biosynthesis protein CobT